jgi:hypothetical protein
MPQWLEVDLGEVRTIDHCHIVFHFRKGDRPCTNIVPWQLSFCRRACHGWNTSRRRHTVTRQVDRR